MGLTRIEVGFYARLLSQGVIQPGGRLLEFGESECLAPPEKLLSSLRDVVPGDRYEAATAAIATAARSKSLYQQRYGSARALYSAIFAPESYSPVDIEPGPRTLWVDLNRAVGLGRQFDYVINNGTSEHVFDQANVYRAIHDHTAPGGLMIHWTPTLGWVDHGLFNAQPGFFFDLAAANGYQVEQIALCGSGRAEALKSRGSANGLFAKIPKWRDSLVCAALRKIGDAPFVKPMQGQGGGGNSLAARYALAVPGDYIGGWKAGPANLALGMPATQSSTSPWSWSDAPEVDARGANNGMVTGSYGFHTDLEDSPWWKVDLGHVQPISRIVLFNRIDQTDVRERAARLRILCSSGNDADGDTWRELAAFPDGDVFGGADGQPLVVALPQATEARWVKIELLGRNYLHLDEVEVY